MQRQRKRYEEILKKLINENLQVSKRTVSFPASQVSVLYIKELTQRKALVTQVIRPLIEHNSQTNLRAAEIMGSIIFADDCTLESDETKIEEYILSGMAVILFSNDSEYIVINLKQVEKRAIPTPEYTYTMRGPRDCFIENIETNISLIRYRIKNNSLRINTYQVGERTKTRVCVLYMEDIANNASVKEVKKRIGNINIDGIIESGELQAFMLNKKINLFPQMGIIERSDMACGALLEGKIIVLVEGSAWALVAPKVFSEFLWSGDESYDNKFVGLFIRLLRILALMISFTVSSLYVAIVSFHNDILPSSYIIAISETRAKVPFHALIEVLLIELIVELIRESLIRVPSKIGTAIGIVGAIIIGQAAVAAGVFSPLLLIVISISLIASFVPSDYTLVNPFRVLKFILIIATGTFGLYGFTLVVMLVIANLVSINSFGVPYMAPYAPFNGKDFLKSIFYSKTMAPKRPNYLRTKDKYRGKTKD